eukprot:CAMPEP_0116832522 /NCGR_PEP_ID=MMETSP0418-20121206/5939_1 /TAXON_ID=1158023 /ORGANISM="Astrosyne radiata, Strain 13vi08-1A" /LENGTH=579 /DNA_ID=CAMNT_0004461893 /DNA_START=77 /DNA_END=1816 /DNA_ORIENTATION=+
MTDFPYLFYINNFGGGVCVRKCPSLVNVTRDNLTDVRTLITYAGIWQTEGHELPESFIQVGDYMGSPDALECSDRLCYPNGTDLEASWRSAGVNEGFGFAFYAADSYPLLWRCILTTEATSRVRELVRDNSTLTAAEAGHNFWNDLYADIWTARWHVLGFGFAVSLLVSFGYIFILRIPLLLSFAVWSSIFITIGLFVGSGIYAFQTALEWDSQDPPTRGSTSINALRICSFILIGLGVFLFLLACCLRRQIQLAIGCVRQAGRAIHRMPGIVFVPVLQGAGLCAFMIPFTFYAVYLASLGKISTTDFPLNFDGLEIAIRTWDFDEFVERCGWYLLFCLFWTGNFIVAVGDMVIAMSVAKWYFTREKKRINSCTVIGSIRDTFFYHLGTCAFGSLILAIVQIIRAILSRVQKKIKEMGKNGFADALLCCCQCCLWCFEKCIKFLNKNAYIQTAIFGTPFCKSAREAFFLILRNAGRIGAITYVSGAVLIIGKLFISAATTSLSFMVMNEMIGDEVFSLAGPTIIVFIISYFVSDMFLDIFDMGITTILQCFVADEEMFEDTGACFAEGRLRKYIDEYDS